MLMDAEVWEGGVKNQPKSADIVYGQPLLLDARILKICLLFSLDENCG